MKTVGIYLLQLIAASAILYGYYHFFLKNKKFHQYNRYYLLAAIIISLLIPFLQIPFYFTQEEADASALLKTLKTIYYSESDDVVVTATKGYHFDWNLVPFIIYGIIAAVLLGKIIFSVWKVKKIINAHPSKELQGVHFVNTTEPGTPFSFFRWLFWNRDIELESEKGQKIFRHEIFHIQQKHSWDVLFAESISMLLWINPFFHIIKKELRAIHEFLADEFASKEEDKWEYAELLLMQALQTKQSLVTPFFHNQIKRRIAMITNSQKTSHRYLRKLLALPLTVLVVMLLAFTYKNKNAEENAVSQTNNLTLSLPDAVVPGSDNATVSVLNALIEKQSTKHTLSVIVDTTVKPLTEKIVTGFRIRGTSIYDTTAKPLIIVNGEKLSKEADLNKMDPSNIESITVLKEPTATSVYGTDGANGVILINTKDQAPLKINNIPVERKVIVAEGIIIDTASPKKLEEVTVIGYGRSGGGGIGGGRIFEQAEQPATFPGGDAAWRKFLERQLNANVGVDNKAPAGTYYAIVQFVVHTDGTVSDITPITNNGYGIEDEAVRVISKGPKWEPAVQNGIKVPSVKKQRITFVVNDGTKPNNPELKEVVVVGYNIKAASTPPSFKGGQSEWLKYLEKNVNANLPVNNGAPDGSYKTQIQFMVKADGSASEFKVLTKMGYGMEEEALRVIKSVQQWEPAKYDGKNIDAIKIQPITFSIESDDEEIDKKPSIDNLSAIYPNPSSNKVRLVFEAINAGKGEIRITDINGSLKMTNTTSLAKGKNNIDVNVSSLANGTYIISLKGAGNDKTAVYKMVKQ